MKKGASINLRNASPGRFVLGAAIAEKISAVEGLRLSPRMKAIVKGDGVKAGEARRARILQMAKGGK